MNTSSLLKSMDILFNCLDVNYYVTAADRVYSTVDFNKYPIALIVNTDPERYEGRHWISFYMEKRGDCQYFDSYGLPIERYWNVQVPAEEFTLENCNIYQSSLSDTCGNHCLFFLYNRAIDVPYSKFVSNYTWSAHRNDNLVRRFVDRIPSLDSCAYYPCNNKIQICKKRVCCSEFM